MSPGTDVVVVDDHVVLAESLAMALRRHELSVRVLEVPRVSAAPRLLQEIRTVDPGVVLLDLDLGKDTDGVSLIRALRDDHVPVVVLTGSRDPIRHGQCLADGARGVLSKSATIDEIVHVLHDVLLGRQPSDAQRTAQLVQDWHSHVARQREIAQRFERLTEREREVLHGLMRGLRPNEIAQGFHVSKHTVRSQVKSILTKLGVASQLEAVAEARRLGWPTAQSPVSPSGPLPADRRSPPPPGRAT